MEKSQPPYARPRYIPTRNPTRASQIRNRPTARQGGHQREQRNNRKNHHTQQFQRQNRHKSSHLRNGSCLYSNASFAKGTEGKGRDKPRKNLRVPEFLQKYERTFLARLHPLTIE
jgi:hypothetical protein